MIPKSPPFCTKKQQYLSPLLDGMLRDNEFDTYYKYHVSVTLTEFKLVEIVVLDIEWSNQNNNNI